MTFKTQGFFHIRLSVFSKSSWCKFNIINGNESKQVSESQKSNNEKTEKT